MVPLPTAFIEGCLMVPLDSMSLWYTFPSDMYVGRWMGYILGTILLSGVHFDRDQEIIHSENYFVFLIRTTSRCGSNGLELLHEIVNLYDSLLWGLLVGGEHD